MNTQWPVHEVAQAPVFKATILWDDTNMEKDTLPLTTYVSPKTGVEYLIVRKETGDYTRYQIVLNGNLVQFALTEEGVPASVAHFENPGPDLSSRYD